MPMVFMKCIRFWKKHPWNEQNEDGFYNYGELAHSLTEYVRKVRVYPCGTDGDCAEHPFDSSWGCIR